jgi:salicylate hydroxylase
MPRDSVAIAGAGIGGLTAALALAQRGFAVTVLERAAILEEVGAGIQISPNAMRVLAGLGLEKALGAWMVEPQAIVVRRGRDGAEITRMPLDDARERWGAAYGVIHRADLQRILYEAATRHDAIAVTLDARLTEAHQEGDAVALTVDRGTGVSQLTAAVAVGADGLWSTMRTAAGFDAAPVFAHRRAFRTVIPFRELPAHLRAPVTTLWLGHHAHLVHYPVLAGDALNVVAVVRDEGETPGWSEPDDSGALAQPFAGWWGELREVLTQPRDWRSWPLFDRPRPGPMAAGRVALLGDAAHPVLPFVAQGGAMAIEDAAVLAAALGGRRGDMTDRLAWYADARASRVARVQRAARRNGHLYHWGWPHSAARDAGLRLMGGRALLARYDWIYRWTPPAP